MSKLRHLLTRSHRSRTAADRAARPNLENLESRLLLYSTLGGQWTYDSRITYSFMPDGTSIGGVPSALFQTLEQDFAPTATWENQIEQAATLWENATNVQSGAGSRRRSRRLARRATSKTTRGSATSASAPFPCRPAFWPRPLIPRPLTAAPTPVTSSSTPTSTGKDQLELRPDDRRGPRVRP